MRVIVFCEAHGDFETATGLVDRVLREEAPQWVGELLESNPDDVRVWLGDGEGRAFFDLHRLTGRWANRKRHRRRREADVGAEGPTWTRRR